MRLREAQRFRKLATAGLRERFGTGLDVLAPAVRERLLLAEAATLVLAQDEVKYEAAQTLLRAATYNDTEDV